MDDRGDVRRVAEQLITWRGNEAYAYVREQAEVARGIGDRESAITWCDIALTIVQLTSARADVALAVAFAWFLA